MNYEVQKRAGVIGVLAVLLVALWAFDNTGYASGDYVTGYQVSSASKVPGYDLQKGWNFIGVSFNIVGKTLRNVQGNCYIKDARLSTGRQISASKYKFTNDDVLGSFWVHVRNDCSFHPTETVNADFDFYPSKNLKKDTNYVAVTTDMVGDGLRKRIADANLVGVSYDNRQCQLELKGIAVYDNSLKDWTFVETLGSSDVGKGAAVQLQCASEKPKVTTTTGAAGTQKCMPNKELSRSCTGCRTATITVCNSDGTATYEFPKQVDQSCTGGCEAESSQADTTKLKCTPNEEVSRSCTGCRTATITVCNSDGTATSQLPNQFDQSCTSVCATEKTDTDSTETTAACISAAWSCGGWSDAANNCGTRTCTLTSSTPANCKNPEASRPPISQDCKITPTCTDKVKNGDETGIDCGGSKCAACPAASGAGSTSTTGKPDLEVMDTEPMFRLTNRGGEFKFSELKAGDKLDAVVVNVKNKGGDVVLKGGDWLWYVAVTVKGLRSSEGKALSYSCSSYDYPNVGPSVEGKLQLPKAGEQFKAGVIDFPSGCEELKELGEYEVIVTVDSTNVIDEGNEGEKNNVKKFTLGEVKQVESCSNIGDVAGTKYCSSGRELLERKAAGAACAQHYECISYVCSARKCLSDADAAKLVTG